MWSFYDGSRRRRRFEPSISFAFFSRAKCSSRLTLTQLSCWHGMMMPRSIFPFPLPPRSFVFAEIFERIGPRERLVLWDPFGAVQCELGITSRHVCSGRLAWPLASLDALTPCVTCGLCAVAFAFGRCIGSKQPQRQQAAGIRQKKGPARAGHRGGRRSSIVFALVFDCFSPSALADCGAPGNERPLLTGHLSWACRRHCFLQAASPNSLEVTVTLTS